MRKPSLYGDERSCLVCGNPDVERHHIYPSARRKISEREGCTVYLCHEHHQGRSGAHGDKAFDMWLRMDCQRRWEEREGLSGQEAHDAFRKRFYVSYL